MTLAVSEQQHKIRFGRLQGIIMVDWSKYMNKTVNTNNKHSIKQFCLDVVLCKHHLFEVATSAEFTVHHVMEDGDHHIAQVRLGHQCGLQEEPNHGRDEVQLVLF